MKIKLIKMVSWTLCACVLTLCAGVVSYEITKLRLNRAHSDITPEVTADIAVQARAAAQENKTFGAEEEEPLEYYVARMTGKKLAVFLCSNNTENFAYTLDVDFYSLSEQDQALLTQGVVLYNKEELAKFIEDFTS